MVANHLLELTVASLSFSNFLFDTSATSSLPSDAIFWVGIDTDFVNFFDTLSYVLLLGSL